MKITVCGSMTSYGQMLHLKVLLDYKGYTALLPEPEERDFLDSMSKAIYIDTFEIKIRHDYIRKHYNNIMNSHCILVANYSKNGIVNYIGGNTFLEMGFAYVLGKSIYLVNPIPAISFYYHEMRAMCPTVVGETLIGIPSL